MPKKPRTNKRPPPKALPPKSTQTTAAPSIPPNRPMTLPESGSAIPNPYLNNGHPVDFSSFVPPPSTIDPKDPNFPNALSDWSASTLGKLNALPKLTQGQLSAIAEAAVGVANGPSGGNGGIPDLGTLTTSANGLPIDLPASLAALFEAKLTLDREKAKLLRMQKELKAHREQMHGVGNGKGKEVALNDDDDDLHDCSCGGAHGHHDDYPASAHSGEHSDDYGYETDEDMYACSAGCGCDCHAHFHEEDCDCGDCQLSDDHDHDHGHDHDHHHHHHHHGHNHHHGHHHDHDHDHDPEDEEDDALLEARTRFNEQADLALDLAYAMNGPKTPEPQPQPQLPQNDIAEQVRNATVQLKNATAEANRAALLAEAKQGQRTGQYTPGGLLTNAPNASGGSGIPVDAGPRRHLSEDPDRLDELVRELFNWIKAVVWTIEQAAVVAGRRNWHNQSQVD